MKTNKMVGLILGAVIAFSGLAALVYAPSPPKIRYGEYSGRTMGKIMAFRDYVWAVPSYYDVNGLPIAGQGSGMFFIYVNDANNMVSQLLERNIDFALRDAIVQIPLDVGERIELNVLAYVLPNHSVGDVVDVYYYVRIQPDGSVDGRAMEVVPGYTSP